MNSFTNSYSFTTDFFCTYHIDLSHKSILTSFLQIFILLFLFSIIIVLTFQNNSNCGKQVCHVLDFSGIVGNYMYAVCVCVCAAYEC